MKNFPANLNNENSQSYQSQSCLCVSWEVIKNHEYKKDNIFKVVNLYVIKVYEQTNGTMAHNSMVEENCRDTILIRVSVTRENVFFNKLLNIEIMKGILPIKFNSKKKNATARLQDLSKYLKAELSLVDDIKDLEESLLQEYKDATQLLRKTIS